MYSGGTFNELYKKYASDPELKKGVEKERKRLDAAVTLMQLREKEGLTQRELAIKAGKPQSTIARIESGSVNVRLDTLTEIANAVGKTLTVSID